MRVAFGKSSLFKPSARTDLRTDHHGFIRLVNSVVSSAILVVRISECPKETPLLRLPRLGWPLLGLTSTKVVPAVMGLGSSSSIKLPQPTQPIAQASCAPTRKRRPQKSGQKVNRLIVDFSFVTPSWHTPEQLPICKHTSIRDICATHPMAPSPLHAAFPEHRIRDHESPASRRRSGSGSGTIGSGSQRTRRLQLRNAGFRAAAVPTRKVTPKAVTSTSTTCSTTSSCSMLGTQQSSDAENVSPSGRRSADSRSKRVSSGILQEIGNSAGTRTGTGTIRQKKRVCPRVTSGSFDSPDSSKHDSAFGGILDLSPELSSAVPKPIRTVRTKRTPMSFRRSLSAEKRKYVDHLELELQSAQAQLQAATSPTVTREQSAAMRHLKAENNRLSEDVANWEAEFDERVQERLQASKDAEDALEAKVRLLEDEVEERAYRVHELEIQLQSARDGRDSVEAANVNLEKRLEIMSELLAASPTKIDLHAQVPGRPRPPRPQSMVQPRFPTAGFLMSPERPSQTRPPSPSPSLTRFSPGVPVSPINLSFSPDVASSDEGSKITEASASSATASASIQQKKPTRRMRRFGAGSIGPKPLILPSTSHREQIPASASALDNDENPFSSRNWSSSYSPRSRSTSPYSRRRSSSEMNGPRLGSSPFPDFQSVLDAQVLDGAAFQTTTQEVNSPHEVQVPIEEDFFDDDALLDGTLDMYPVSGGSNATTRNFDSLGSAVGAAVGRNLMEELTAVRNASSGFEQSTSSPVGDSSEDAKTVLHSSPFVSGAEEGPQDHTALSANDGTHATPSRFVSGSSTAVATASNTGPPSKLLSRASSNSLGVHSIGSLSTLDSLRHFFGDMFDSPVALAKHLIEAAQRRMWIPRPLLNIQWWLVGVLLGPMAKKRLLAKPACCREAESEQSLLDDSSSAELSDMAFGSPYQTPPTSSPVNASFRHRSLISGKGKKRTASISKSISGRAKRCAHHANRYKHSPWLWLKFSMTLAIAVGVAFKDGPSTLLKDAFCECKRTASGNWRHAMTKRNVRRVLFVRIMRTRQRCRIRRIRIMSTTQPNHPLSFLSPIVSFLLQVPTRIRYCMAKELFDFHD
ncbi:uncharacterized protein MYCFIDRAFT_174779 [Pseudocercospora fijiensis CIRAD86]|uniref:Uncharacterized protein n=1 Tax=Pseudocercospora fijiensis (strain CIRAD86) TaxID=383855 RepID=M3AFF9_PSEFD|nr:uncharacterized protein MYCFIDRAFT_174779 [Pseudocercospora fijiensis CIRAD86]EME83321.1 hypothetical protein MYCFIDRAFT_174779 [Pseudocercospora fijiensis CIRAD86]